MFCINGIWWDIQFISPYSNLLIGYNGELTVGMTDWNTKTVYLANNLYGEFLLKVLTHEITHCYLFSYNVKMDILQEEIVSDIVATYGRDIIDTADSIYKII